MTWPIEIRLVQGQEAQADIEKMSKLATHARRTQLTAPKPRAPRSAPKPKLEAPMARSTKTKTEIVADLGAQVTEQFETKLAALVRGGLTRAQAVAQIAERDPNLHAGYLCAANAGHLASGHQRHFTVY